MPIEITEKARARFLDGKKRRKNDWSFIEAISEPDLRPTRGAARIVQAFLDFPMLGKYNYARNLILAQTQNSIDPDELDFGQMLVCINRAKTILAVITQGYITYKKVLDKKTRIDMRAIENLPRCFSQNAPLDYDRALGQVLQSALQGVLSETKPEPTPTTTRKRGGNTQAALDIINAQKQRTILRKRTNPDD